MEILFENRFVRTKEILQEFYRYAYFRTLRCWRCSR